MRTLINSLWDDVHRTLFPPRGAREGVLPPLLVGMTVITGLVDAFSYLVLGHVFVANMTGNVVFLGFALAGAAGFSVTTSLIAIGAFICGAVVGGGFRSRLGARRGRQLATAAGTQLLLLAASAVLSTAAAGTAQSGGHYALVAMLAVAMGLQNATARSLGIADLTTTVLTMTLTGIAADAHAAGGTGSRPGRRLISVGAMLVGALAGGALVIRGQATVSLLIAVVLMAVIVAATRLVTEPARA